MKTFTATRIGASVIVVVAASLCIGRLAPVKAARAITIVTLGDSTTASRNVGAELSGRPPDVTSQGDNDTDPANGPHNVVRIVSTLKGPSPWLYIYSDILRDELPGHGIAVLAVDNEGIGGDRTDLGLSRIASDVETKSPDAVVIQFGMNDAWWDSGQPVNLDRPDSSSSRVPLNRLAQTGGDGVLGNGNDAVFASRGNFADNLTAIVSHLQSRGARIILMTPNQINPAIYPSWQNKVLGQYAQVVRDIAAARRTRLVDVWKMWDDYQAVPGHDVSDLLLDGQHPNARGHRLEATALVQLITLREPNSLDCFDSVCDFALHLPTRVFRRSIV